MAFHGVALLSLLSLVLVLPTAGLECRIYVSSHHGTDNTPCWTGGAKTPCDSLYYALNGIKTLQDSCSKGIDIYLYPGSYKLYTESLEQQLQRNNVSIIGIIDNSTCEVVTIYCGYTLTSFDWSSVNIVFQCVETQYCPNPPVTTCTDPNKPSPDRASSLYLYTYYSNYDPYNNAPNTIILLCNGSSDSCPCEYLKFYALISDACTGFTSFPEELNVCITSINSLTVHDCYTTESTGSLNRDYYDYAIKYIMEYKVWKCFDDYIDAGPIELSLLIKFFAFNINNTLNIKVTAKCASDYYYDNVTRTCVKVVQPIPLNHEQIACDNAYNIPCIAGNSYCGDDLNCCENSNEMSKCCDSSKYCYDDAMKWFYTNCTSKGVPVNNLFTCVECGEYDLLIFIAIEIVPITLMVLLIIIFNIQLTNGFINGVVFYSQSVAIIYTMYYYYYYYKHYNDEYNYFTYHYMYIKLFPLTEIPCNIFNLDFTPFVYNYPLCISPNTTPLGVLSFWYVIGFYPLLLLLLLYVWITLYDKGYKCVVFITRPFHRCMARFWSMTGIEPSFTHSIASIYILCFTQLTATSFKILSFNSPNPYESFNAKFFYDMKQGYFQGVHAVAGSFAILVLMIMIVLPTLYILFYRFKWFHKLLDRLHLRKQLLISLADVFTGPYKNGTENTFDYRFMAGLYLLERITFLCFFIYSVDGFFMFVLPVVHTCCSFLLAVIVLIFRPFQRNIHNFAEFVMMFAAMGFGFSTILATIYITGAPNIDNNEHYYDDINNGWITIETIAQFVIPIINGVSFVIIIPGYIIYQVYKMIKSCHRYHKRNIPVAIRDQEDEGDYQPLVGNDDDWIADRMENPQEYDEQHVPGRMYDVTGENHEPVTIATAATFGSINNATINND